MGLGATKLPTSAASPSPIATPNLDRKPLIAHTIQIAIESEKISRVIVSTDSPKIAKECYESKEYQHAYSFLNDEVVDRIIHIAEGLD